MAIPASVTLYVRWTNGQPLSGTTYTHAGADVPASHTWTAQNGATLGTDADAPWNGQYMAELDGNNRMDTTVSSATVATTTGRFYIEAEGGPNANGDLLAVQPTTVNNGRVKIKKTGGGNLLVNCTTNGGSNNAEVDLGVYPTGDYAVEVIYDIANGTAANRLQARTYGVGDTPPSFTTITGGSLPSGTTDEFINLYIGDNTGWDNSGLKVNRIAFSDDITEDLSALDESSGVTVNPGRGTDTITTYAPLVNPQTARAVSDTGTIGGWTPSSGGDLYAMIDEATRSDSDYIQSGVNPSADAVIMKLQTITDPSTDNGFHVQWAAGAVGGTGTIAAELRQGNAPGTLIASWTHTNLPVGSYREFDDPVTSAQAANITDYSDLYIKLTAG